MMIHRVKHLVEDAIDDPYTLEQMQSYRMNNLTVRPLVEKLYQPNDISVVYCLLVNRIQFLRQQVSTIPHSVNIARATLCELVAARVFRRFHEDNPSHRGILILTNILVEGFDPFQGAPAPVVDTGRHAQWPIQHRGGRERQLTALELAIISESKLFLSSTACQRVVNAVYCGHVTYSPLSFIDIIPDHYKHHSVGLYDPRKAPVLNQYRLIVPRIRNTLELIQFFVLVLLYVLVMIHRDHPNRRWFELLFWTYSAGWILDEVAAIIEHGWEVHAQNLWSFLDVTFILIFGAYVLASIAEAPTTNQGYALSILCLAAPVLLTRMAFTLMPDNIVFISLHALMKDFMFLTFLALWCFLGFLLALQWLIGNDDGTDQLKPGWTEACKWLLWIWFGLDGTGIEESVRFDVVLGPVLMIAFAFLGNTLFLTILVAMLTNTFSKIVANEAAEIQFRRAALTFQAVKSDSIFSYPPPCNIAALIILLPLKLWLSPRAFHTVNVAMIRIINAPTLLLVHVYERIFLRPYAEPTRKSVFLKWNFTGFSPHGDIHAVFLNPPAATMRSVVEGDDPPTQVHHHDQGAR
ncbi:hypothetical protein CC79DRAFT_1343109 [Sarocladium strictum]